MQHIQRLALQIKLVDLIEKKRNKEYGYVSSLEGRFQYSVWYQIVFTEYSPGYNWSLQWKLAVSAAKKDRTKYFVFRVW